MKNNKGTVEIPLNDYLDLNSKLKSLEEEFLSMEEVGFSHSNYVRLILGSDNNPYIKTFSLFIRDLNKVDGLEGFIRETNKEVSTLLSANNAMKEYLHESRVLESSLINRIESLEQEIELYRLESQSRSKKPKKFWGWLT